MTSLERALAVAGDRLAGFSVRHNLLVVALAFGLAAAGGVFTAQRLSINTDLSALLSEEEPWRQLEDQFDRTFPQLSGLLILVVDGATPELADQGAEALVAFLRRRDDLFSDVSWLGGDPFFRRHGLLYLSESDLERLLEDVIEVQPLLGSLAIDPTLRGLFETLSLGLEGVTRGDADLALVEQPLAAVNHTIGRALEGGTRPLSWQTLLSGEDPDTDDLRRFIRTKPRRDFSKLTSAGEAMAAIRAAIEDLGLTPDNGIRVRLTGNVAIEKEELETLSGGTQLSGIVSFTLVSLLLVLALRSARLILPILATLIVGLICTTTFATVTIGSLNPISIAFAVLFVGLGVDFGIQFGTRFRAERFRIPDPGTALRETGGRIGPSLAIAALSTAAGFLAFLPTAYLGVSQLGLIAGAGMAIAVVLNLTLLPALLSLARPPGETEPMGYSWAAPADRFIARQRIAIIALAGLSALAGIAALPSLRFDFNPMNLRDPATESVATAIDLMGNPDTSAFTIDILMPDRAAARETVDALRDLPEVARAISIDSFIPKDQDNKLFLLEDAAFFLGTTLSPGRTEPTPNMAQIRATIRETIARLRTVPDDAPLLDDLANRLERVLGRDDRFLAQLDDILLSNLETRLESLALALSAGPVTYADLPKTLRDDWVTPDGQARILVSPTGDAQDNRVLQEFVAAVRSVAPVATGTAVTIQESARTIVTAFVQAGATALVTITLILLITIRRITDVLMVLAPMVLAALLTTLVCVLFGPSLNFANIIALPLMLGIGVAFNIYFVLSWRAGTRALLQSSTARAVLFSALTTFVAFGSLALSDHPGTASMGVLLMISLGLTLLSTLFILSALLASSAVIAGSAESPVSDQENTESTP